MRKNHKWTDENFLFVQENKDMNRKELLVLFNKKFNSNISLRALQNFITINRLCSRDNGRYKEGHSNTPWNKSIEKKNYFRHYDKEKVKAHMQMMAEKRTKIPIGTERIFDGALQIKVEHGRGIGGGSGWERKRKVVWEEHNGCVPKGFSIIHLDGDKLNCDIDNLVCIPNKYKGIFAKQKWFSKPEEVTKTAIKWCELYYALKDDTSV